MPASGDLKYGESLSFALLLLPHSPDKHNWTSPQIIAWVWQYMTSYMKYRPSKFSWQNENIFVSDKIHAKFPRNCTMNQRNFWEKWTKFQTKAQKAQKPILSVRFVDLDRKSGDGYRSGRVGIYSSLKPYYWQPCIIHLLHCITGKIADSLFWIF